MSNSVDMCLAFWQARTTISIDDLVLWLHERTLLVSHIFNRSPCHYCSGYMPHSADIQIVCAGLESTSTSGVFQKSPSQSDLFIGPRLWSPFITSTSFDLLPSIKVTEGPTSCPSCTTTASACLRPRLLVRHSSQIRQG